MSLQKVMECGTGRQDPQNNNNLQEWEEFTRIAIESSGKNT